MQSTFKPIGAFLTNVVAGLEQKPEVAPVQIQMAFEAGGLAPRQPRDPKADLKALEQRDE